MQKIGSTLDLKHNCFLALEDNPNIRQDHFKTKLEAIGMCSCRTVEDSQGLSALLGRIQSRILPIQIEMVPSPTIGEVSMTERVTSKIKIRK